MPLTAVDFGFKGDLVKYVNGAGAAGLLAIPSPHIITEGYVIEIFDGVTSVKFEFDRLGDGVTGGNTAVDTSAVAPNDIVAATAILAPLITASALTITATINSAGNKIALANTVVGLAGNVDIVAAPHAGFTIEGMSGGSTAIAQAAILHITESYGQWTLFHF